MSFTKAAAVLLVSIIGISCAETVNNDRSRYGASRAAESSYNGEGYQYSAATEPPSDRRNLWKNGYQKPAATGVHNSYESLTIPEGSQRRAYYVGNIIDVYKNEKNPIIGGNIPTMQGSDQQSTVDLQTSRIKLTTLESRNANKISYLQKKIDQVLTEIGGLGDEMNKTSQSYQTVMEHLRRTYEKLNRKFQNQN